MTPRTVKSKTTCHSRVSETTPHKGLILEVYPCIKPANKPVATRTVFTTQIWDVYWNNSTPAQDGWKAAQSMRRCWKKERSGSLRRPKSSSEHRVTATERNSTAVRDGRESSSEHGPVVEKRTKSRHPPRTAGNSSEHRRGAVTKGNNLHEYPGGRTIPRNYSAQHNNKRVSPSQ